MAYSSLATFRPPPLDIREFNFPMGREIYPIINSKTAVSRRKQDSDFQITCLNITLNNICWFISVINVYVMAAIIITILIYRRFDTPTSKGWMVKSSLSPFLPRQYYECRGGIARSRRKHCFHYYYLSHFHPCANCRGTLHTGTLAHYTFGPSSWAEGLNNVFSPLRIQDEFNVMLSIYRHYYRSMIPAHAMVAFAYLNSCRPIFAPIF